jgi:hypothetical protein
LIWRNAEPLESSSSKILLDDEKFWRLKSRVLWDQNTEFFQNFANHWKNFNTIWELNDPLGNKVWGFSDLELWE